MKNENKRLDEITLMLKVVDRAMQFKAYDREALFNSLAILRYAVRRIGDSVDWNMMLESPNILFRYYINKIYDKNATAEIEAIIASASK